MGLKYKVDPSGGSNAAMLELQARKVFVVSGAAASTSIAVSNLKAKDYLLSVIGHDAAQAAQADKVKDFTALCSIAPNTLVIGGIAKTAGVEAIVTINGHPLLTGDYVKLNNDIGGSVELRNKTFKVEKLTANTFKLLECWGDSYTAFTSGGTVTLDTGSLVCTAVTTSYRLVCEAIDGKNL